MAEQDNPASNPGSPQPVGQPQPEPPKFDGNQPHMATPKLRPIRAFPVPVQQQGQAGGQNPGQNPGQAGGQQPQMMMGLGDARQISTKIVVTTPAVQRILPLMDGSRDLASIVSEVGQGLTTKFLEDFVARLDDAGLIEGPTADAIIAEMREQFDKSDNLPPGATAAFADQLAAQDLKGAGEEPTPERVQELAPSRLSDLLDKFMDEALKSTKAPPVESLPKAVIAPHLDYSRGWLNYGAVYGRLRGLDRPDRIIVLGTNHFGEADGVCGCDKGYESPLGLSPLDTEFVDRLKTNLGSEHAEAMFKHRFDHEREHSIELHIPWIQRVFGPAQDDQAEEAGEATPHVPVFAALVHDPVVNNGEPYRGEGLGLEPFVEALAKTIAEMPGRTLVVSSADLSHVGPAFGDQQRVAGDEEPAKEIRKRTTDHDREMLTTFCEQRFDDLLGSLAWQQNPTRWCSVGNMLAAARVVEPEKIVLVNYMAAVDNQGAALVSSCAAIMQ